MPTELRLGRYARLQGLRVLVVGFDREREQVLVDTGTERVKLPACFLTPEETDLLVTASEGGERD